jgi:hypothetical protein
VRGELPFTDKDDAIIRSMGMYRKKQTLKYLNSKNMLIQGLDMIYVCVYT